jgi:hypothetical protein
VHNDTNDICVLSVRGLEIDKLEYQEMGHFYQDRIATYMEELSFSNCPWIHIVYMISHSLMVLFCEDQVGNQSMLIIQVVFIILVKNNEKRKAIGSIVGLASLAFFY